MTNELNQEQPNTEAVDTEVSEIDEQQEEFRRVSKRIQDVLEEEGYALQPFMFYSEFGVGPRVRLTKASNETNNDEQEPDTGEASLPEDEDGAVAS